MISENLRSIHEFSMETRRGLFRGWSVSYFSNAGLGIDAFYVLKVSVKAQLTNTCRDRLWNWCVAQLGLSLTFRTRLWFESRLEWREWKTHRR